MPPHRSFLASKPVLDADSTVVGHIAGAERDPDTKDTVSFLVHIDPVRTSEGEADVCWLPADQVRSIRRDSVSLTERLSTILPCEDGRRGAHHSARR